MCPKHTTIQLPRLKSVVNYYKLQGLDTHIGPNITRRDPEAVQLQMSPTLPKARWKKIPLFSKHSTMDYAWPPNHVLGDPSLEASRFPIPMAVTLLKYC